MILMVIQERRLPRIVALASFFAAHLSQAQSTLAKMKFVLIGNGAHAP
jgi:hypothetical protein